VLEKNKEAEAGNKFYANTEFGEQDKRPKDLTVDALGPIAIPNIKAFWIQMNKKGLYMLSSRRDPITKFKHFTPFKNLKVAKGGNSATKDLGQFDEGFCSQVTSIDETLVVCFNDAHAQANFLALLNSFAGKFTFQENKQMDFQAQLTPKESAILNEYPPVGKDGRPIATKLDPNVVVK